MKNLLILLIVTIISGCSYSAVEGGQEAVLVYKPWIFGHGGVDETPVKTGATYTAWSTSVIRYNIKPLQFTENFVDLTASDNVAIDFHSYITLQIISGQSPVLHENFGEYWYENRVKEPYRTMVRNEGRVHSSIDLRTKPETINKAQDSILAKMKKYLKKEGIPLIASKVVIGKVNPPDEVLKEAERTAAQKQKETTEITRAKTELARAKAEKNKALADKAYAREFKMTTDQFLRNKELDIIASKENVSVVMGVQPFVNIK